MFSKPSVIVIAAIFCWPISLIAQDAESFPYQALVLNEQAPIRSGPGKVHYATDNLEQGTPVQVYRHDPGGWCPVRPPEGSFSLIPETTVEIIEDGIGRIIADGTQAWVGTRLGAVDRPQWQVKLKKDEQVEILGEVSWPNPEGHSTIWYQIAPPAGEFRWIHISDLQLPVDLAQIPTVGNDVAQSSGHTKTQDNSNSEIQLAVFESDAKPPADIPFRQVDQSPNRGWRQASSPIPVTSSKHRTSNHSSPEYSGNISNPEGFSSPHVPNSSATSSFNDSARFDPGERYADSRFENFARPVSRSFGNMSVAELDFQLSQEMINKTPDQWKLEDLKLRVESIRNSNSSGTDWSDANRLLEKLENCKKLRSNYIQAYKTSDISGSALSNGSDRPIGSGIDTEVEMGATYDAYGYLNKLERDNGRAEPTYVLQDENGKITHHVSGVQGLNLHRYLKQKVGLIGQRGYHQKFNLKHVTVERVAVLDRNNK